MAKYDKTEIGISTLLNPVPVVMVSCAGENFAPNITTVAWAGTVNSEPPMLTISLRKSRLSHEIISQTGEFVVNLVNKSLAKSCDLCGVKSGRDINKFETCSLTPIKALNLDKAVAIKEAPVSLSCKVKSVTELGSHDMFLAEIVGITASKYLLDDDGKLCLDNAKMVAYNHGEYFLLGEKIGFFGYSVASSDIFEKRMGYKKERDKYKRLREQGKKNGKKF